MDTQSIETTSRATGMRFGIGWHGPALQGHGRVGRYLRPVATCLELAKPRLTSLVLVTTAVGFLLACQAPVDWALLAWAIAGTALAGAGANGLNQCLEAAADARMSRTLTRPVAAGRISPRTAAIVSINAAVSGTAVLAATVNAVTADLAAAAVAIYVLAYTPLKQRTTVCTLIGAVVGALPPVMGWTAARGRIDTAAWILAAILFVWQIPHSLALAWLYRHDYVRGGYHILSWNDTTGRKTFHMIVLYCLCLLPVSLAAYTIGLAGPWYVLGALLLGSWLVYLALRLQRSALDAHARSLFFATVTYLPLLLGLMLLDRRG